MTGAPRVLVAMSGGVDSSVAAALLLRDGYDVVGITLQLRSCDEAGRSRSCCGNDALTSARAAAARLGIPHYILDRSREFEQSVLRRSWDEYARGRTPNPCVECNREFKFGVLLEQAQSLGAAKVATGHYARIAADDLDGSPLLLRGTDKGKDQSYFLFTLTKDQLRRVLFPLGGLRKTEVRDLAREFGLPNAEKAESQDACFVNEDESFAETLRKRFDAPPISGRIVDSEGVERGRHSGIHQFTIGQRQGLGVSLGKPAWVRSLDSSSGTVTITTDERDLLSHGMIVEDARWTGPLRDGRCEAQIRYRHPATPASIEFLDDSRARVRFDVPQRAVTPGQAAVFYDRERVLGGGWIAQAL